MRDITRDQYAEVVMSLLEKASWPGADAEMVVELKLLTSDLSEQDPWPPEKGSES